MGAEAAAARGEERAHGSLPEGQRARLEDVDGFLPWERPRALGGE